MDHKSRAHRPPPSKFKRLATTHALMVGGDAAMVVALADSLFFDMDLNAARTRVMLFLALSFAPFLFVAPLIGPMIDRMPGGRRFVIQGVALSRTVLLLLMAQSIDSLALFPLVFASLVLQKTYIVSKSALVPSTVRSTTELIEANSKLGLISGLTGAVAVIPAAALLVTLGAGATMVYSALLFGAALVSSTKLPGDVVAATIYGNQVYTGVGGDKFGIHWAFQDVSVICQRANLEAKTEVNAFMNQDWSYGRPYVDQVSELGATTNATSQFDETPTQAIAV